MSRKERKFVSFVCMELGRIEKNMWLRTGVFPIIDTFKINNRGKGYCCEPLAAMRILYRYSRRNECRVVFKGFRKR